MRLRSRWWLLLMALGARASMGQVDTSAWPLVRMEVLVLDQKGAAPVPGTDAFAVFEDSHPVKLSAVTEASEPQSVCLLLDTSGSMHDRMVAEKAAAARLLSELPAADKVCVQHFNAQIHVDAGLSKSRDEATHALAGLTGAGGSSLFDALVSTATYLRVKGKYASRAIIVLTDGDDNMSGKDLAGTLAAIERGGGPAVHVIRLESLQAESAGEKLAAEKNVVALSRATGGIAYFPKKQGELEASVDELCRALGNRVILSYETAAKARDGRERRVSVELKKSRLKKLKVFAVEGYYAPSQ